VGPATPHFNLIKNDIPCEDVGHVMRLCISGFEPFAAGKI
jgi:hypothetical protein